MLRFACLLILLAAAASSAPPLVHGAVPPMHEGPSEGPAIHGPGMLDSTDAVMNVCMIRVQFLEDFTDSTTGNGRMDLEADPPHDLDYFRGIADDVELYYEDVSRGELDIDIDIYPTSQNGCYTLQHQMMHYGHDSNPIGGACFLLRDAVQISDPDIDFSQYDAVIVIHAGAGQEADIYGDSPGDIGSVFLTLTDLIYNLPEAGFDYQGIPTDDNVYVSEGMIDPEQESQDGFGLGVLGTICHELGHQLGLPDLYDTSTGKVGVGGWDLMGYGQWLMSGYWPSSLSAWSRIYLGWDSAQEVSGGTHSVVADSVILRVPLNSTEYLLIENRQRDPDGDGMCGVHEHDFGLAGSGILIWHIDETRLGPYIAANMVNVDADHKGVDLEEADGIQDFDYSLPDIYGYEGSPYDPWYREGYAWEFSPFSEPSSDASWGGRTFVTVEVLSESSDEMDVDVTRGRLCTGWPVTGPSIQWGPMIWTDASSAGRDLLVVTKLTGQVIAYEADGSGPLPLAASAQAPPAAGDPVGDGIQRLLVCDNAGQVHLLDPELNQPEGWPATLSGGGVGKACLVSDNPGLVAVADDDMRIHLLDSTGTSMSGWPVTLDVDATGLALLPREEGYGIAAATLDGRIYLWDLAGNLMDGWPVTPGSENTGYPLSADFDRDGVPEVAAVSGNRLFAWEISGDPMSGFPYYLNSSAISSPFMADLDSDGMLEIAVPTRHGIDAVAPSGATLEDWPVELQQDSLIFDYDITRTGSGGSGFIMTSTVDGRICYFHSDGNQVGAFPLTVGDTPIGRPLLWDPEGNGNWRVVAADAGGSIYCWNMDLTPQGWFTGLDMSGANCWRKDDLPVMVSAQDGLMEGSFYVYPNPVSDGTGTIRFRPGSECSWEIRVFSMAGDLVASMSGTAPGSGAWEEEWITENLAPGVYFVTLSLTADGSTQNHVFHAAVIN